MPITMGDLQDVVAIVIAVGAAAWLGRSFRQNWAVRACGASRPDGADRPPPAADGFVPVSRLENPRRGRETARGDP